MDRLLLILSTLAFASAVVLALVSLKAGKWKESRWHWVPMAVGLALQSAFLYLRGQQHGRCPLTNLFEVFIFIGWAIVLLYFLVGTTYRLSLLGVFTAPMIALLQGLSLISSLDQTVPRPRTVPNPWLETHAAVSLIAYAAFAMACVTGIMYLVQARMLKRHNIHGLFYQLPPIHELAKAIQKLTLTGSILLSAGLAASIPLDIPISNPKLIFAWTVWGMYLVVNVVMWRHLLSARQTAWLAVVAFIVPLVSVGLVTKA
jgi:ABC-type uncharacterized transport system permease subunit